MTDLVERNRAAVTAHEREIGQAYRIQPLATGAACHDGNIADVLADLGDRNAGEQKLELLASTSPPPQQTEEVLTRLLESLP